MQPFILDTMPTTDPASTSDQAPPSILIRPMQPTEGSAVRRLARQTFRNGFEQFFFELTPHTLVAEQQGRLVGAVVLKHYVLGGRQLGEVAWLFTVPAVRGLGAGQQLVEAGLDYLANHDVELIYAMIEGNNSSSFKQFTNRGFQRLSPATQLRLFGFRLPWFWLRSNMAVAYGHFLYGRAPDLRPGFRGEHWLYVSGFHALQLALAFWWWFGDYSLYPPALVLLLLLLTARGLAMLGTARLLGLPAEFRAWEAGSLLSLLIASVGGVWMLPGSVYPQGDQWRYRDEIRRLGIISFAGAMLVVLGLWSLLPLSSLDPRFQVALAPFSALAIVDVALPFLRGYNSARIWQWSRLATLVLLALLLAFFGLRIVAG
jgi:N-acetylglutamate synthase-like GNAT family acetyltransferase